MSPFRPSALAAVLCAAAAAGQTPQPPAVDPKAPAVKKDADPKQPPAPAKQDPPPPPVDFSPAPAAPPTLGAAGTNAAAALAAASNRGTDSSNNSLPAIFGDLPGGGQIAGPFAGRVDASGRYVGRVPVIVRPDGSRYIPGPGKVPNIDELLLVPVGRDATPGSTAGTRVVAVTPPRGDVFDPSVKDAVTRYPQIVRGTFKISENDTPRPTTRVYFTYNFYDQLFNTVGSPDAPRAVLHQQTFGYEHAFADRQFSVGVRLPYNQLVSPGYFNDTGLGDLTFLVKAVVSENRDTGDLLSAGVAVTVPSGSTPFANTLTGQTIRGSLIQPYAGYIVMGMGGRAFAQGFASVVVPTDSKDSVFIANSLALGYYAYQDPQGRLAAVVPTAEFHLNTPLTHRGAQTDPVGFVDSLTLLGGVHAMFRGGTTVGLAAGSPLTGPRPFSLQATLQVTIRF